MRASQFRRGSRAVRNCRKRDAAPSRALDEGGGTRPAEPQAVVVARRPPASDVGAFGRVAPPTERSRLTVLPAQAARDRPGAQRIDDGDRREAPRLERLQRRARVLGCRRVVVPGAVEVSPLDRAGAPEVRDGLQAKQPVAVLVDLACQSDEVRGGVRSWVGTQTGGMRGCSSSGSTSPTSIARA
jgi:hypothetical protein